MPEFQIVSDLTPSGDQPEAIRRLVEGLQQPMRHQTLLGATGTGKTFTISQVIESVQRPALVIAHNKTLAAQLYAEFRDLFPGNLVRYFVSYYDYYQPEAYLPQTDMYIEKDVSINDEIDRLRHAATEAISSRRDTIVVASVSCIYGMGSPEMYQQVKLALQRGAQITRTALIRRLIDMQFLRNSTVVGPGQFRVRGDVMEICPASGDRVIRVELFGDEIDRILFLDPLTGEISAHGDHVTIYPATHYVTPQERLEAILAEIRQELEERLEYFRSQGMLLEAQRLEQRTLYDIEIIRETGTCSGIENYSRYFDGRRPGEPAFTLLDYFPDDSLLVIDEAHQTVPQLRAMCRGDRSRKDNLVRYGFRLPSAYDNRPLRFEEFEERVNQVIYMSATPGPYELEKSEQIVEQIVRPTGLVDPQVEVRPTRGQIDDLIGEIRGRVERGQRVLVTTLTKKMAENLTDYLAELQIKVQYLHSDVKTLERVEVLRDLRAGRYDVLVGVNLLREGLDLPEVSLIAIMDADREGFLRSETSLIQTIGRAARNIDGRVIMYAEETTESMRRAIEETERRRQKQAAYNELHGITPQSIRKAVRDLIEREAAQEEAVGEEALPESFLRPDQIEEMLVEMEREMFEAAGRLDFEEAAELRDEIAELKRMLAEMKA